MIRAILFIILAYVIYKMVRASFRPSGSIGSDRSTGPFEDEMVKDPHCQTYFPKRMAYKTRIHGETLYFCSKECSDRYKDKGGDQ